MTYIINEVWVGNDICDVLCKADFVLYLDEWMAVLGYDPSDDIICLTDHKDRDHEVLYASTTFKPTDVKIACNVVENLI